MALFHSPSCSFSDVCWDARLRSAKLVGPRIFPELLVFSLLDLYHITAETRQQRIITEYLAYNFLCPSIPVSHIQGADNAFCRWLCGDRFLVKNHSFGLNVGGTHYDDMSAFDIKFSFRYISNFDVACTCCGWNCAVCWSPNEVYVDAIRDRLYCSDKICRVIILMNASHDNTS